MLPEPVPSLAGHEERGEVVIVLDDDDEEEPIERPCRGFWLPLGIK